mgnify:CR=1 FL=1
MPQAWVGDDCKDIGKHVEPDIDAGENQTASLHDGEVSDGYGIDHVLTHSGVNENDFDHDDAHHEIGKVQGDNIDDRRERIWSGMLDDGAKEILTKLYAEHE